MAVTLSLVLILSTLTAGSALTCLQCSSLQFHSGNSALEKLLGGKTDAACEDGNAGSVSCDDGAVCGSYKGMVKGSYPLLGELSMKVTVRDCAVDWGTADGCSDSEDDDTGLVDVIDGLLGFLTDFSDVHVSGKVCTCSSYDCNDQNLDCNGVNVTDDFCLEWWVLGVSIGGVVLVIILLCTCCCCCCCGCCRKTPQPVSSVVYTPAVVVGGVGAIENPGYNQFQTVPASPANNQLV